MMLKRLPCQDKSKSFLKGKFSFENVRLENSRLVSCIKWRKKKEKKSYDIKRLTHCERVNTQTKSTIHVFSQLAPVPVLLCGTVV